MEYGLANVMEQYETKYKARQLLGHIDANEAKKAIGSTRKGKNPSEQKGIGFLNMISGGTAAKNDSSGPAPIPNLRDEIGKKPLY